MRSLFALLLIGLGQDSLSLAADPAAPADPTVLVIHGGAGVLSDEEMAAEGLTRKDFEDVLAAALRAGYSMRHKKEATSVDVVEAAIRVMEDSPRFNAGHGAALTIDGRAELDAAIMEGKMTGGAEDGGVKDPRKRAGAVAAVTHIKNPISAARAVMEMEGSRHVMLVGEGAEEFALSCANQRKYSLERVSNAYFWTDRRLKQIQKKVAEARNKGTVGAVAVSDDGHIAAGTSTGGLSGKLTGRVGDTPIIGAGTYADDRACGVSCTGTGEVFIRHAVAHDVVARMLYAKTPIAEATQKTIDELPDEEPDGVGGLIALDAKGQHAFAMSEKSHMYRGYVTKNGKIYVQIFAGDKLKLIEPVDKK
jgi:L-asparaginase / beta-aspartyl-peptidase